MKAVKGTRTFMAQQRINAKTTEVGPFCCLVPVTRNLSMLSFNFGYLKTHYILPNSPIMHGRRTAQLPGQDAVSKEQHNS